MLAARLQAELVNHKIADQQKINECFERAREQKLSFINLLIKDKIVAEKKLISFLSKFYNLPVTGLSEYQFDDSLRDVLNPKFALKHGFLPIVVKKDRIIIATSDPTQLSAIDELKFSTRKKIDLVLALPSDLDSLINHHYGTNYQSLSDGLDDIVIDIEEVNNLDNLNDDSKEDEAPIINFVNNLLVQAIGSRASDIHVEPYENDFRIRFRVDGKLFTSVKPPVKLKNSITARLKVMANLRLDEKRLPQDGRIRIKHPSGGVIDFRVNSLPTIYGEKIVLRILDRANARVKMEKLGFEEDDLTKFQEAISSPWGICLVTGATGSGKTTTLYSAINWLMGDEVNISTIEDPVEYNLRGINQVNVKEGIGLTFAETLRALLRQDPDVVLLGEIRDGETAEVAMKAALTGHMVLSTLHTNDAPSSIMRLKDMGIDLFLINSALKVIIAQRLVRRICLKCKIPDEDHSKEDLIKLGFPEKLLEKFKPQKGKGCSKCNNSGYYSRAAIHEILVMNDRIKEALSAGANTEEIRKLAKKTGMRTLRENCMRKVIRGVTTIEELNLLLVGG